MLSPVATILHVLNKLFDTPWIPFSAYNRIYQITRTQVKHVQTTTPVTHSNHVPFVHLHFIWYDNKDQNSR